MGYTDLIKKVQDESGLTNSESRETLDMMVESIAERLDTSERRDFALQLPAELQDVALTALPVGLQDDRDILREFMDKEDVQEDYAKTQIIAAWQSLKSLITDAKMITEIKSFMPATLMAAM
jgi:uncharacterized protein (DUF2267 family)